jgi:iron complex outermembrane receptor protein
MKRIAPFGLAALAIAQATFANEVSLNEVVVTATRFREEAVSTPANVVVITRQDIQDSPAVNLPDLLKTRAGLEMRSLYGSQAMDVDMDLRGFGEGGDSHVLVLLDGRRLNPIDFGKINWSAIPLGSIERIEIIRGSGTVLYGDNAVGGVINIVTDRQAPPSAHAALTAGSFATTGAEAHLAGNRDGVRYELFANDSESDAYRRNNQTDQRNLNGRVSTKFGDGEAFGELALSRASSGLPGAVTAAQYQSDPRATNSPDDWQSKETHTVRGGVEHPLGNNLSLAAEAAFEDATSQSWLAAWGGNWRDTGITTVALTPRLRWQHGLGSLVAGIDYYSAKLSTNLASSPGGAINNVVKVDQDSRAFYVQNVARLSDRLNFTLGARQQKVAQAATDSASGARLDNDHEQTVWDAGLSWQAATALRLFGKTGTTFRFAKTDELTTFGGLGAPVRPEHGDSSEIGAEWKAGGVRLQATVFDLRLNDEIAYNALTYQNENLDKTLHRGAELDAMWPLGQALTMNAAYSHTEARFRAGANDGKTIPLVPADKASLGLTWKPSSAWTHALAVNYVGERWFGGDVANQYAKLGGYTESDWLTSWRAKAWTVTAKVQNLFNRKYAPLGYDYGFGTSYYPANPLSAYVTARYEFR